MFFIKIRRSKIFIKGTGFPFFKWLKSLGEPADEMVYDLAKPVQLKRGFGKQRIIIPLLDNGAIHPDSLHGVLIKTFAAPEGSITSRSIINQPFQ